MPREPAAARVEESGHRKTSLSLNRTEGSYRNAGRVRRQHARASLPSYRCVYSRAKRASSVAAPTLQPPPGGAFAPGYNAVNVAARAVKQGTTTLLIPITAHRQLNDLSDDLAVKISILSDVDVRAALIPARGE